MYTETHSSQLQSDRRVYYEDTRDFWEPRARKSISLWEVGPVGQEKWKQSYWLPLPFCLHRLGFCCFSRHGATYSSCIVPLRSSHIQDLTDTSPIPEDQIGSEWVRRPPWSNQWQPAGKDHKIRYANMSLNFLRDSGGLCYQGKYFC